MKLVTYNIHKGIGGLDRVYNIDRIIDVLTQINADFVCLQEVDRNAKRSAFHDQPAVLAEALGAAARLDQFVHPHQGGGYGNLILSRWPFDDSEHFSIRRGRRKRRGVCMASLATPSGPVLIASGHFGLNERERHWQAELMLCNSRFIELAQLPTFVALDSTDWRNRLEGGPFKRHGFFPVTAPAVKFRSFPAYMPIASLDKVFARGPIAIHSVQALDTKLTRAASDHLPIVVDFSFHEHSK